MNAIKKIRQHFSSLFLPVRKAMPFVGGAYRIVLIVTLILSLFWVMSKPVKNWITTIGRINVYDSLIHGGRPDVMASFVNGDWVSSKEQMALLNGVLKVDAKRMNVSAALLAVVALVMSLSVIVFDSVIACGGLLKRIKNYVFLLSQADGNYSGVPLNFEQGVVKAEDGKCDDLIVHHVEKTTTPIAVMSGFSRTHARGVSSGRRQLLDWINRVNHVALFAHVYRTQLKRRLLKVRRIHALGLSPRASLSITSSSVKIGINSYGWKERFVLKNVAAFFG